MSPARSACVVLGASLALAPSLAGQSCGTEYAGVTVGVAEEAHDGRHAICPDSLVPVDANSDLVIEFVVPSPAESVAASPEWQRIATLIGRVSELERDVARLNSAPTPTDAAQLKAMQSEASAAGNRAAALLESLDSLPISPAERRAIITGRFPGGTGDPRRPYTNLNQWLDQELRRLTSRAEAFAAGKQRLVVQVTAFRDPRGGKRSALHVEHYDDLPVGELRPIDRTGLQLTPAERASWEASVAFNQTIATALRDIQTNRQTIETRVRDKLRELGERLQRLAADLAAGPDAWVTALPGHIQQIRALAATASPESQAALQALAAELDSLRQDYSAIRGPLGGLGGIAATVRAASTGDLRQLLFQAGGIVDQLGALDTTFTRSLERVGKWPARLDRITAQHRVLGQTLPADLARELLPADAESFFKNLAADLPGATGVLVEAVAKFTASRPPIDAQGTLTESAGKALPHSLDDLPTGRVELARAGWVPGDRVLVSVAFLERQAEGEGPGRSLRELSYRGEAVLTGLHRELSSALIFARPVHGGEQVWKTNVAALVSWHYYKRSPRSFGGRFWNWLNPGLGIHLASLDQTTDNFEFGVGGNLTIWNGLLSGGYGWNLSRANGEYALLAVDLFEALNRVRR